MIRFIKTPNLPEGRVCQLICGADDEKITDFFSENSISVLKNDVNSDIDKAVSDHADMAALHLGENRFIVDSKQIALKKSLVAEDAIVIETSAPIEGSYPSDVKLNFAITGNYAIGNFKHIDFNLKGLLSDKEQLSVKQGYCKCSVLVVNENAIITDDESICRKAYKNGIDCLSVLKGDILLPGHEYGFIGGASGKIAADTIVFFGDIKNHRDADAIIAFLEKHSCHYVCTDEGLLRDIGGIIPVKEII